MVRNSLYKNGSVIAVWVDGDTRQETLENYWSFWNHGATSAEDLHWINPSEGYFWSNRKRLKRYFKNSSRAIVLNELGENWICNLTSGRKASKRIAKLSEKRFTELMDSQGPNPLARTEMPTHMLGTIDAENPYPMPLSAAKKRLT